MTPALSHFPAARLHGPLAQATPNSADLSTIDWVLDRGVPGVLAIAIVVLIVSGSRRWWIWKWTHDEIVALKDSQIAEITADRDYYRDFAMRTLNVGEALASRRRTDS